MKGFLFIIAMGTVGLTLSASGGHQENATGSIEGTVVLAAQRSPVQSGAGSRYGRPARRSATTETAGDSVLIWLAGPGKAENTSETEPVILDQQDLKFVPSLLAVPQNGTVRIRNSDPVYHNVFSLSGIKKFDVGRRPKGEYMDVTFDRTGIVNVFCDIHSSMHAVIYVLPTEAIRWQKVKNGEPFTLSDIPEGSYRLSFYAVGYEEQTFAVEVKAEETSAVGTITLNP